MKIFNWEDFKNNKIIVHCKTEEEAKDFIKKCYNNNLTWMGGDINTTYCSEYNDIYYTYTGYISYSCSINRYKNLYNENGRYLILEWGDYMECTSETFTKDMLENGMIVELNNGEKRFVLNEKLIDEHGSISESLNDKSYTIKKVYKTNDIYFNDLFKSDRLELIWEHKEKPKEMTQEEIEKILGYKVKIITNK